MCNKEVPLAFYADGSIELMAHFGAMRVYCYSPSLLILGAAHIIPTLVRDLTETEKLLEEIALG